MIHSQGPAPIRTGVRRFAEAVPVSVRNGEGTEIHEEGNIHV